MVIGVTGVTGVIAVLRVIMELNKGLGVALIPALNLKVLIVTEVKWKFVTVLPDIVQLIVSGWNGKIGNLVQFLVEKEDKAEKGLKSHYNLAESHVLENNLKAEHVKLKTAVLRVIMELNKELGVALIPALNLKVLIVMEVKWKLVTVLPDIVQVCILKQREKLI